MCKKGLKELINWFSSKAGMIDSACMALIVEIMPQVHQEPKKNKNKENNKDIQRIQLKNIEEDEDNGEEPITFSLDNTRDDTILKALEDNDDYKNEVPNEMEMELGSTKIGKKRKEKDEKKNKENEKKKKKEV